MRTGSNHTDISRVGFKLDTFFTQDIKLLQEIMKVSFQHKKVLLQYFLHSKKEGEQHLTLIKSKSFLLLCIFFANG